MSSYHRFPFEEAPDGKDGWERTGWLTLDGKKILVPNVCIPIEWVVALNKAESNPNFVELKFLKGFKPQSGRSCPDA